MALQGTLDTFALADLVRLMATTTKTGQLTVEGEDGAVAGHLRFADGDLVDGEPGPGGSVEEALFALLRLDHGSFRFDPDAGTEPADGDEGTWHRDALDVLAAAEARLEAWRPVEALVPHADVVVTLRPELEADQVTVDRATWRQITAVAGGTTARNLAAALDLDEVAAATAVKDLADLGLVEVSDAPPAAGDEGGPVDDVPGVVEPADAGPTAGDRTEARSTLDEAVAEGPAARSVAGEWATQGWESGVPASGDLAPDDTAATSGAEGGPATDDPKAGEAAGDDASGWGAGWDVEVGGSLAVDLDSHLGGPASDHRYLGGEASALPEALPRGTDDLGPADEDVAELHPGRDDEDLALQLEALSPAAARAVAAAAASDEGEAEGDEGDAGRRVLRRIISSGRG